MPTLRACTYLPVLIAVFIVGAPAQQISRANPADPAHPFDTPGPVSRPASAEQLHEWQKAARTALFMPDPMPALAAQEFGSFSAMPGVVAHRVTYGTEYGMRVPAIVYMPEHPRGKLPAIIVVAGHGGDKTTWYEVYAGLLYASAGAVVVTYDPIGEDERNAQHLSDARAHDTVLPGAESPARLGGLMIGDVSQAVSYALSLPHVDAGRIAVLGYSMGSFHAALAAGLDPRIRYLVDSGGGDLDGNGGSWDSSSKIMCQGGPYQALSFLPDKGAILYALHQRVGQSLVLNGMEDRLVAVPHHDAAFFDDLNARVLALAGAATPPIDYRFYKGVGHRPSWVDRDAAVWLNERLHFPSWRGISIDSLGEVRVGDWAKATGAHINRGYDSEITEAGIHAVGHNFPAPSRADLQVVPMAEWQAHENLYTWEAWARRTLQIEGLPPEIPAPASARESPSPTAPEHSDSSFPGYVVWPHATPLEGSPQKLSFGTHSWALAHREVSGQVESHETRDIVMVVQSGEATLIVGNDVVDPTRPSPNELRGSAIRNGIGRKVTAGDVINMPAGLPHQFVLAPGRQITYIDLVIPVPAAGLKP